jgi:hypothetical protein
MAHTQFLRQAQVPTNMDSLSRKNGARAINLSKLKFDCLFPTVLFLRSWAHNFELDCFDTMDGG